MAKSKYFQKKKDEPISTEKLTVDEALDIIKSEEVVVKPAIEEVIKSETPQEIVTKVRQAYDVFFDRTDMTYKIVTIHYDDANYGSVIKTEIQKLDKNQAKAASTIQKIFAMKFLKRT